MKCCKKCGVEKDFSEFRRNKKIKSGYNSYCNNCQYNYHKEWRLKNPLKPTSAGIRIYESKKLAEELLLNGLIKCSTCKTIKSTTSFYKKQSRCKSCQRDSYIKIRDEKRDRRKRIKEETKHTKQLNRKFWEKNYYIKNKNKYKKRYAQNKTKLNKQRTENHKKRYLNDELYRFKSNLRTRTSIAFSKSRWNKNTGNEAMLGCSYETAFKHIEKQFTKGMSWSNKNKWHIDHIIPLASAKDKEELIKLCHYKNLQPLWAEDNLKKGTKIL